MTGLTEVLRRQYAIDATAITPCEGGLSALAFRVDAPTGPYVLKVYDKGRAAASQWTSRIDSYVPVLDWLNRHTALHGRIVEPVYTVDGRCKHEDAESVYLLCRYMEGFTVGDADLTEDQDRELGRIVGLLHCHGESDLPCPAGLLREDFSLPFCDSLATLLATGQPQLEGTSNKLVQEHRESLGQAVAHCQMLAAQMKAREHKQVLCHSDIHNFNLIQGDRLVLIDWEGLMLAPRERDLMFIAGQEHIDPFLDAYTQHHPGYTVDKTLLGFYLLRRDLEDIWAFLEHLVFDAMDEGEWKQTMAFLDGLLKKLERPTMIWRITPEV